MDSGKRYSFGELGIVGRAIQSEIGDSGKGYEVAKIEYSEKGYAVRENCG